jgi:VWFA-related protein
MSLSFKNTFSITILVLLSCVAVCTQGITRDINVSANGSVEVINKYGRIAARAEPAKDDLPVAAMLKASSSKDLSESDVKVTGSGGRIVIVVSPKDTKKRIDLTLTLPERTSVKAETVDGAVDVSGDFASVEARTGTGTISADVPDDDLKYSFEWTESRPRYLADFDIAEVKEKSAGRFTITGKKSEKGKVRKPEADSEQSQPGAIAAGSPDPEGGLAPEDPAVNAQSRKPKAKKIRANPQTVSLYFTTARGIILLNVPPSEVMSDLRERPLTEAAKAIIRSGDSLLMEAIRRASPKYFGDYTRTLPPMSMEPRFTPKSQMVDNPRAATKTATVRVTDLKNRSIDALTANDFEVTENGTSREVMSVARSTAPFNLVLLLDVSGSVENYVNFIRKAARSFVETVDKQDRVSIVIFNEDVTRLSPFTTDKEKLSKSLDMFDAGGGTAYYDALAYTVADTLRPLKGERTAIVILTDGDDNRSFLAFDSLMGSIQESGALIYPLYVPSALIAAAVAGADIDPIRRKYMSLTAKSEGEGDRLARVSGGVYYPITQIGQIQQAYEDIVLQLRSAYSVTFRSDDAIPNTGASPRLKIRAKRDNVFTAVTSIVAVP